MTGKSAIIVMKIGQSSVPVYFDLNHLSSPRLQIETWKTFLLQTTTMRVHLEQTPKPSLWEKENREHL